jgi:hypothetical protein
MTLDAAIFCGGFCESRHLDILDDVLPAQSWGYSEVLAAVRVMWIELQICLTEAQLSALPGTIRDCIYEECLVRALLP